MVQNYKSIQTKLIGSTINAGHGLHTLCPSSQLIHRSPLVRKQATACLARWWIQPSCLSWVMMASMKGNPVLALKETFIHSLSHPHFTRLGSLHSTAAVKTRYLSPRSQVLCVFVPVHLSAHRVALHLVKVGDTKAGRVEELSPEELAVERDGRVRVLPLQHKQSWNLKKCSQKTRISWTFQTKTQLCWLFWAKAWIHAHKRGHSPPDRLQSASTKTAVQTGSRKWRRGWGRWCWDLRSWETSAASQTYTPTPEDRTCKWTICGQAAPEEPAKFLFLQLNRTDFLEAFWGILNDQHCWTRQIH